MNRLYGLVKSHGHSYISSPSSDFTLALKSEHKLQLKHQSKKQEKSQRQRQNSKCLFDVLNRGSSPKAVAALNRQISSAAVLKGGSNCVTFTDTVQLMPLATMAPPIKTTTHQHRHHKKIGSFLQQLHNFSVLTTFSIVLLFLLFCSASFCQSRKLPLILPLIFLNDRLQQKYLIEH